MGPAVRTAFPAAPLDSFSLETSLFFLLPQICDQHRGRCSHRHSKLTPLGHSEGVPGGSHRHEHGTIVGAAQLGDAVQEDGGHLLVLVLDKAEHFEGKAAHLALPVLEDGGLGVFFAAGSMKLDKAGQREEPGRRKSARFPHTSPKEKVVAEVIVGVSGGGGVTVVH